MAGEPRYETAYELASALARTDPHQAMLMHRDDGRYAHVPHCNKQCDEAGHWLEADVPTAAMEDEP